MKPANASAMRSTSDQVSVHRHIRSPDELTLSLRPSQFRMSCSPIASTCDSHVKQRCRAVPTASSLPVAVPHAVAATASVKFGWEHSCQGDFVKLGTVGEPLAQEGELSEQGAQQQHAAVAVLNIRRGDQRMQHETERVDQQMALLALDQLAATEARRVDAGAPFSALLTLC